MGTGRQRWEQTGRECHLPPRELHLPPKELLLCGQVHVLHQFYLFPIATQYDVFSLPVLWIELGPKG